MKSRPAPELSPSPISRREDSGRSRGSGGKVEGKLARPLDQNGRLSAFNSGDGLCVDCRPGVYEDDISEPSAGFTIATATSRLGDSPSRPEIQTHRGIIPSVAQSVDSLAEECAWGGGATPEAEVGVVETFVVGGEVLDPSMVSVERDPNAIRREQRSRDLRRALLTATVTAVVLAAVLGALGATGKLGGEGTVSEEKIYCPPMERHCSDEPDGLCWNQVACDLYGSMKNDEFGAHVSLSHDGSRIAVSAEKSGEGRSAVWVYDILPASKKYTTKYGAQKTLVQVGQMMRGNAGVLSGDGRRLLVGGGEKKDNQVFDYDDASSNWMQVGELNKGSKAINYDGTVIAAVEENPIQQVSIHALISGTRTWVQLGVDIKGEGAGSKFGRAISLSSSGLIVAAGDSYNEDNGFRSGHVRLYQYNATSQNWHKMGTSVSGIAAGDWFGGTLSLSGDGSMFAAGAIGRDGGAAGRGLGHIRSFQYLSRGGGDWIQRGESLMGTDADDLLYSVSLSSDGTRLALGGISGGKAHGEGYVLAFDYNNGESKGTWLPTGGPIKTHSSIGTAKIATTLSGDGKILATGGTVGGEKSDDCDDDDPICEPARGVVRLYELV